MTAAPTSTSPSAAWSAPAAASGSCCPTRTPDFLLLRPLGGGGDDVAGVFPDEGVDAGHLPAAHRSTTSATPPPPTCCAPRCASGSRPRAGPFRSLAGIGVSPRATSTSRC